MTLKYTFPLLLLLTACQTKNENSSFNFTPIPHPCINGGEPNLFTSETGEVYLSWIAYENDTTDVLQYAQWEDEKWTTPKTIAQGSNWFVNWADFPSLAAYEDSGKTLAAHWLQKSAEGTYDYDVHISQSKDGGETWQTSFIPHQDGIAAEHGFVNLVPLEAAKMAAVWLDGRHTKGHDETHKHKGAMTLRTATFDPQGNLMDEVELDNKVCDCCQTSAAVTDEGLIVAYRDRSEGEIRDVSVIRQVQGQWTSQKTIGNDNWQTTACPVNGPVIRAEGQRVALAWFTSADGEPKVQLVLSEDAGATFSKPIRIDEGNPLGRVDVLFLKNHQVIVSWLEASEEAAEIKVVAVAKNGEIYQRFSIAKTSAARKSGFPRMTNWNDQALVAWTGVDSLTSIRTGVLTLPSMK